MHVAKQLDFADYDDKQCSAGRNYINVMPNGDVYTCLGGAQYTLSPLQEGILARSPGGRPDIRGFAMGNLFDRTFRLLDGTITCKLPCTHACDLDAASIKRHARSAGHRQLPVITNG